MSNDYEPDAQGMADNGTVVSINFLENKHLRLVSIGEVHYLYDINKPNLFHEWIAQDKISEATLIIELGYRKSIHQLCQDTIRNYFDPDNIFLTDGIRGEFTYLSTRMYVDPSYSMSDIDDRANDDNGTYYVKDFLTNSYNHPTLEREYLTKYMENFNQIHFNNSKVIEFPFEQREIPGLAVFMDFAAEYNNVYNIMAVEDDVLNLLNNTNTKEPKKDNEELKKLVNIIMQIKKQKEYLGHLEYQHDTSVLSTVQPPVQTIIIKYELLLYQYIAYNFIYRVCRWVMKYKVTGKRRQRSESVGDDATLNFDQIPQSLYMQIVEYMRTYTKSELEYNKMSSILARMLDYIAILKILDLYDAAKSSENKVLVWLASGSFHNMYIDNFINWLFKLVGDPFTIDKKYHGSIAGHFEIPAAPAFISDWEFTDFTNKNPQFGLSNRLDKFYVLMTSNRINDKYQLLYAFGKTIEYLYPHIPDKQYLLNLLEHDSIPLRVLHQLVTLVTINVPLTVHALKIILKCTEEELQIYGLVQKLITSDELVVHDALNMLITGVKPFSEEAYQRMKDYTFVDMMAHPDNISFRDMVAGKSILELPKQSELDIIELNQLKQEYLLPIKPYDDMELPIKDYDYWVEIYRKDLMIKEPLWKTDSPLPNLSVSTEEDFPMKKRRDEQYEIANAKYMKVKAEWELANPGKNYEEIIYGKVEGGCENALLLLGFAIPMNLILLAVLVIVFLYLVFNIACQEKCPPRYTVNYGR